MFKARYLKQIRENKLFRDKTDLLTAGFFDTSNLIRAPKGFVLWSGGEDPDYFYLILSGTLKLKIISQNKKKIILRQPGHFTGEKEFLEKTQRVSSLVAETDSVLYKVDHRLFSGILSLLEPEDLNLDFYKNDYSVSVDLTDQAVLSGQVPQPVKKKPEPPAGASSKFSFKDVIDFYRVYNRRLKRHIDSIGKNRHNPSFDNHMLAVAYLINHLEPNSRYSTKYTNICLNEFCTDICQVFRDLSVSGNIVTVTLFNGQYNIIYDKTVLLNLYVFIFHILLEFFGSGFYINIFNDSKSPMIIKLTAGLLSREAIPNVILLKENITKEIKESFLTKHPELFSRVTIDVNKITLKLNTDLTEKFV